MANEKPNYRLVKYESASTASKVLASVSLKNGNKVSQERTFGFLFNCGADGYECDCNKQCGCEDVCSCDDHCRHCKCVEDCTCDEECRSDCRPQCHCEPDTFDWDNHMRP